jgi:hypothetical protein
MTRRNRIGTVIVGLTASLIVGCASSAPTAEKAASTALSQLLVYERAVSAKIKAEDDYYERVMDAAAKRIDRLRQDEQPYKLEVESRKFAASNASASASALRSKLVALMDSSMNTWKKRDEGYLRLLDETRSTLAKNRQALTMERARIASLRGKLRVLSEARNMKDMLSLMVAYTREVKGKLDELREDAKAAEKIEDS